MTSLSKSAATGSPGFQGRGIFAVLALLIIEIVLTGPLYKLLVTFDCWNNWPKSVCNGFNMSMVGVYTGVAALALLAMLLPVERRALFADAAPRARPLVLNLVGVAIFFIPVLMFHEGNGTRNMGAIIATWAVGLAVAGSGALLMLAPASRWGDLLRARGGILAACLGAGLAAPYLAKTILPLWRVEAFSDATFHSVNWLMNEMGYAITTNFETRSIGDATFVANIAPLCSGIEGMALIAFFVTLYLVLFRGELRFPAALLLYPIGLVASWLLNVARITALIALGVGGHPELAVGGFHSHAGWLMFTVLSLAIIALARSTGFFTAAPAPVIAGPRPTPAPFFADPMVAQILPFAVFMASALLASTFARQPALIFPLRALLMAGVLVAFLPYLRTLTWRLDPVSLLAGLVIGVGWAATSPPAASSDTVLATALASLSAPAFVAWVASRVIGTSVLVPIIEELFFRGYLLGRLSGEAGKPWRVALGVLVTSVLFGALHDRWLFAFVAGVVYAGLRLRSGRISDAILAHAASNAWIAGAAIVANDWSLI